NRATASDYCKPQAKTRKSTGLKPLTLVFYKGRAPKGTKTNWVMQEYRLEGKYSVYNLPKIAKNEWVICKVFQKSSGGKKTHIAGLVRMSSYGNELGPSSLWPPLMDSSPHNSKTRTSKDNTSHVTCFSKPMEDQKAKEDMFDSFDNTSFLLTSTSSSSSSSVLFSKTCLPNSFYSAQISPSFDSKMELSLSQDISSAVIDPELVHRSFEGQEAPPSSAGPIDLDCLWSY
ncbi:hypothetical protein P3X46_013719, partial [Hevea brasiliensis]